MEEKFVTVLSEKDAEEAIKEVSLKIKSVFPKLINYILILFTPQYSPPVISKIINFTLNPEVFLGIQSPLLIFEDKIIEKGIVACAINKGGLKLKNIFTKKNEPQDIENSLLTFAKNMPKDGQFLLTFLAHNFNPFNYLNEVRLSLGKTFNATGAGYIRRYGSKNFQITGETIDEGIVNTLGSGLDIDSVKIGGFSPFGRPFTIDRAISKTGTVMEINGGPAVNIYKGYLEEKFDTFKKNYLFSLYPLGIKQGDQINLISVLDILDDGSLLCLGQIKEGDSGYIMNFCPESLFKSIEDDLAPIKEKGAGFIFIINSLIRKKILKGYAREELKLIKRQLGEAFKVTGIFSDYFFSSDKERREIMLGTANLLVTFWK